MNLSEMRGSSSTATVGKLPPFPGRRSEKNYDNLTRQWCLQPVSDAPSDSLLGTDRPHAMLLLKHGHDDTCVVRSKKGRSTIHAFAHRDLNDRLHPTSHHATYRLPCRVNSNEQSYLCESDRQGAPPPKRQIARRNC